MCSGCSRCVLWGSHDAQDADREGRATNGNSRRNEWAAPTKQLEMGGFQALMERMQPRARGLRVQLQRERAS